MHSHHHAHASVVCASSCWCLALSWPDPLIHWYRIGISEGPLPWISPCCLTTSYFAEVEVMVVAGSILRATQSKHQVNDELISGMVLLSTLMGAWGKEADHF